MAHESWLSQIASMQDRKEFQELSWEGTFEQYLELVKENPRVLRSAYQRLYDMVISYGFGAGRAEEDGGSLQLL